MTALDQTRIEITHGAGKASQKVWIGIDPDTAVNDADKTPTFATAKLRKNALVVVTVVPEPPGKEWSCAMHTHVALEGPGKCPVCGMALTGGL